MDAPSPFNQAFEATATIYERVKTVITPEKWAEFAGDVLAIQKLKKDRNAIILAHNYMTPEVFHGVADIMGDSLALAREAAKTEAEVIVVAGVQFMAETAKLMNPSRAVLAPDPKAGCSLADSVTPEDVLALKKKHPGVPVITYVNTSAAVKAVSDICCTSANAKKIVESLGVPEVIMIPDEYLALNTAAQTKVKIIAWKGRCEVHERFSVGEILNHRSQHPGLKVLAHPECPPEVIVASDYAGSTAQMIDWIEANRPAKALLMTEGSMSDNIAAQYPAINFVRSCRICPHMKLITLKNIRQALETMTHQVTIPNAIAAPARQTVEKMIAVR